MNKVNYKILLLIAVIVSLFILSYISNGIIQNEHVKTVQLEKGHYYIDRYIDNENNNTCYILYGTIYGGAIGAFGSISCVNNEVIVMNITGVTGVTGVNEWK